MRKFTCVADIGDLAAAVAEALEVNQGAWKLETERGVVMDGDKAEHLLEAIPVMGSYCDLIGVRSFARFQDKTEDYEERVLEQFIRYSGRPVFSMEAATRHPLQSFADLITIEEHKRTARPKVVMTWAPHPNALPQAVPNSFAEWMNAADYDFMHCLPVRRNMIVTDEVIESPRSLVIPEAANREISAQVVLKRLLEGLE